jgi:hypothetical protein
MSTSRKLLLGKCGKGAKIRVAGALRAAGAHFETLDESDAFCAVNLGLSELGGYCFCQMSPSLSPSETRVIQASGSVRAAVSGVRSSAGNSAQSALLDASHLQSTALTSRKSSKQKA